MIRIITDSASDIGQNELKNVVVIPMNVTIEGVTYRDGIDITKDEFFEKLETSEVMPSTSLIPPQIFMDEYEKVKEAGDEAIVLPISAGLSGTYQSAVTAAEDFDNISVIETGLVTAPQKLLVLRALQLVDEGKNREEIVNILEKEKTRIAVFASVDTLKYLHKGGRISKSTAIAGGLLNIKPILTLENGKLISIGKARGSKQSHVFLDQKVKEVGGIDFTMPYATGYSGTDKSKLLEYMEDNANLVNAAPGEIEIVQIGSAVGTHAGPGAVLVTFFTKE
ncbi:MAG: DegV family protein [Lachnospiraceae bacterium]|nr:DegV family protein [Lachnospiraceae bacterium]